MDSSNPFFRQVSLLVKLLPIVGQQNCFALKGGTAINLFIRSLPRLSVDIDLAYIPMLGRQQALVEIDAALKAIAIEIEQRIPNVKVITQPNRETKTLLKLAVAQPDAMVKIEVTPVLRGSVYPSEILTVHSEVEAQFGFAEVPVLSFNDLYAGKICATLDRQHPRDLYDTLFLLDGEGINKDLMRAFLVYLIGHNRPIAELLAPRAKPLAETFEKEFKGMTYDEVELSVLETVLPRLVKTIMTQLSDQDRAFLVSFKKGQPDWDYLELPHVKQLPSVQWKLFNLDKMSKDKRIKAIAKLESVLLGS